MIDDEHSARAWLRSLPQFDSACADKMERFVGALIEQNEQQNLISKASIPHMWQRHIADSAQLLRFVPREARIWLDLGSGAGLPGLVIAMLLPRVQVTLIESRALRSAWLARQCADLDLTNVTVIADQVQRLGVAVTPNIISARAFAPLVRIFTLAAQFSTPDTLWLLPKGRSARQELQMLTNWNHMFHVEQSLTSADAGIVIGHLLGPESARS